MCRGAAGSPPPARALGLDHGWETRFAAVRRDQVRQPERRGKNYFLGQQTYRGPDFRLRRRPLSGFPATRAHKRSFLESLENEYGWQRPAPVDFGSKRT